MDFFGCPLLREHYSHGSSPTSFGGCSGQDDEKTEQKFAKAGPLETNRPHADLIGGDIHQRTATTN